MKQVLSRKYIFFLMGAFVLSAMPLCAQQGTNRYIPVGSMQQPESGLFWPEGQAIPHFATPSSPLDGLDLDKAQLPDEERVMFTSLQGLVNREKPRLFLLERAQEGKYKWAKILNLSVEEISGDNRFELIKKYRDVLKGVVLYDPEKNIHYANLASTIAGLDGLLPVTPRIYEQLKGAQIDLPVMADLTKLPYTHTTEIYDYLYENYWNRCTHRLLVSQPPVRGYVRDLAVAAGTAVVWLDARVWSENIVLRKFLKTMQPGNSIVTGWFPEERSGVGMTAEYGLSTIPSDFYENATVYGGMSHLISYPAVPKMPKLENKIYLAIFLSDGDNVQYCQHAMSQLWDKQGRGSIPINWTISPGLVDFGPGLLNYYYATASSNDFFASGPSGLGYALIYDAHNYVWNSTSGTDFTPYAKLTQRYLEKSGLRVITVWDEVNDEQRSAYARNCRYLYGVTLQDWEKHPYKLSPKIQDNRLSFMPNFPCYASGVDVIYSLWKDTIARFDGSEPLFLSAQGESWKMGPDNIVALKKQLEDLSPGNIVICRGDHFFNLYNEAHHLPFNLTLSSAVKVTASPADTPAELASDGSPSEKHLWISSEKSGKAWIQFDFKEPYLVSRYVVRHAERAGLSPCLNTRSFMLEVSLDGKTWSRADMQVGNTLAVTDVDVAPVKARYVRLTITDPGEDGIARIGDVEIYGSKCVD